jgi:hypothetical protein
MASLISRTMMGTDSGTTPLIVLVIPDRSLPGLGAE